MNVAIIGASGIGKHHANWFHHSGCRIVAFSGTSPESCERTEQVLRNMFDFQGKRYTDYRRMIDSERIDIVCVCSPPDAHDAQVRAALQAGLHVYCEKPFVWPPDDAMTFPLPSPAPDRVGIAHPVLRHTLESARQTIALKAQRRRVFGLNAQYVAAQTVYRAIYEAARGPLNSVSSIYFLLESKGISGRHSEHEGIWIDMSPHPLSQIIAWLPDGVMDTGSIDCRIAPNETTARFRFGGASVEIVLRKNTRSTPRRCFGVNDFIVDYEGRKDEQGIFRAHLRHDDDQATLSDDFMHTSIRHFLDAVQTGTGRPLVDEHDAVRNLEMSMIILERGVRVK